MYWSRPVPRVRIPPSPPHYANASCGRPYYAKASCGRPHYEARRAHQGALSEFREGGRTTRKSRRVGHRKLLRIVRLAVPTGVSVVVGEKTGRQKLTTT